MACNVWTEFLSPLSPKGMHHASALYLEQKSVGVAKTNIVCDAHPCLAQEGERVKLE